MTSNGGVLCEICRQDSDGLHSLRAALGYIGGDGADMVSHLMVVADFLATIWDRGVDLPLLRRKVATGLAFEALLRGRRSDWLEWLRRLVHRAPRTIAFRRYLLAWLVGHFIPIELLTASRD